MHHFYEHHKYSIFIDNTALTIQHFYSNTFGLGKAGYSFQETAVIFNALYD